MRLAGFYEESMSNGKGWRSVIFLSGCPHHCKGCQNPQTWDFNYGDEFDANKQLEIFEKIRNNMKYRGGIVTGVTLSGGEPFSSAKGLIPLVKGIKALGLNLWAYTGYTIDELDSVDIEGAQELLSLVDVLVDGKFVEDLHRPDLVFRGSSNQRIIDMEKYKSGFPIEKCLMNFEEEF